VVAEIDRLVTPDEAFRLQHVEHAAAQLGGRCADARLAAHLRVADAGQHIAEGIVDAHIALLTSST
jgi:hypothetical protein